MQRHFHDGDVEGMKGCQVVSVGPSATPASCIRDRHPGGDLMKVGEMVPGIETFLALAQASPDSTFALLVNERFENESLNELALMFGDAPANVLLPRSFAVPLERDV